MAVSSLPLKAPRDHGPLDPAPRRKDKAADLRAPSAAALSDANLQRLTSELGLDLTPGQRSALLDYAGLLQRWNRVHNLTAIDRPQDLLTHHLLDSLAIVRPLEELARRYLPEHAAPGFVDAGTGAGLPGIPLAIAHPDWPGQLVDAVEKKCAFLRQACLELHLANLTVHHARLERLALAPQDFVVSRAFASLRDFVTLTRALRAPHGLWVAMKGRLQAQELRDLPPGVEVLQTITLRVPQLEEQRHLIVLRPRDGAAAPA